jgi:predicted TPR repeat methyltransferase
MAQDTQHVPVENRIRIALPDPSVGYEQDSEWCVVEIGGAWREIRFHDYADIFPVQGLYERLFYDILQCSSPPVVRRMLQAEMERAGADVGGLRVLDLGAGNGIMAEELKVAGVPTVVGADIIVEAREAALRDRPTVYEDYHILDMTALSDAQRAVLDDYRFTGLTCVAALGFGDVPPVAFRESFNLVQDGGWIAFTIKDGFLDDRDTTGFAGLIKGAIGNGSLEVLASERYRHRLSTAGEPLHYQAIVGRKAGELVD